MNFMADAVKMLNLSELKSFLVLNALFIYSTTVQINEDLNAGIPPSLIVQKILYENYLNKKEALEKLLNEFSADDEIQRCQELEIFIMTRQDERFPRSLLNLPDAPLLLYVRGALCASDDAAVAIVGSRHASAYGLLYARKFGRELAEAGFTVISGLARGIDQAAHEGALSPNYGRTLAVMGCGMDQIYPKESKELWQQISVKGAVLSEYPLGTKPLAYHFPKRNRIISGMSLGVVVVEAHLKSGSLITAREALDQGKDVFALPGPIDCATSLGTNRLIKEGAALVETSFDIIEHFKNDLTRLHEQWESGFPDSLKPVTEECEPCEKTNDRKFSRIEMLLSQRSMTVNELMDESQMGYLETSMALVDLEIKHRIKRSVDGEYKLVGRL